MRSTRRLILASVLILLASACNKAQPDKPITDYDVKEMDQAIARARSEVDWFIAEHAKGAGEDFAVKAEIVDETDHEHFWLDDITVHGDEIEGTISNEPGLVHKVKLGQRWKVKKGEITDWMFRRDGKIHGNYTMRPLLKTMPAAEAAEYRALFAKP